LFFNWRLLQLPVRLLDYVVVHELVHLREPRHNPEFWRALEIALPDWRQREEALQMEARDYIVFGLNVVPEEQQGETAL
jgi:predicted metal-dependent hydrolase